MSIATLNAGNPFGIPGRLGFSFVIVGALLAGPSGDRACAEEKTAAWNVQPVASGAVLTKSVENQEESGESFQRFRMVCASDFEDFRIEAALPASRLVEEFRAVTRINSTHAGMRLAVRLILPNQANPRTGQPLETWVIGNRSTRPAEWQQLTVQLTSAAVDAQLRRVRQDLYPTPINSDGMYAEGCGLFAELTQGNCVIDLMPVTYGPIVALPAGQAVSQPSAHDRPREVAVASARVRVQRSQLEFEGRSVFVRIMPYHGESPDQIRAMGVNAAWLPDYRPTPQSGELRQSGLIIAVTPPHPRFDPADVRRPVQGLVPLEQLSPEADLFILGNDVKKQQIRHLLAWADETQSADRLMRRPIMADVRASESLASRQVDLVGLAEPSLHSNTTFGEFSKRVLLRSRTASQLTLPWVWIHAESPARMNRWRASLGLPPLVVEPEQITMQVTAALSAGARGIGYWKTQPLANDGSEVDLAIALANLQIDLLEPWLTGGRVQSHIAIDVDPRKAPSASGGKEAPWINALSSAPVSTHPDPHRRPTTPDAAMVSGRTSSLVLAGVWDLTSQFVPGPLYAKEGRLTVVASDTASASRVTLTGVYPQRRKEAAGGLPLVIQDFDQSDVFLIASDPLTVRELAGRVQQVAPLAAALRCAMADRKFRRVRATMAEIDALQPDIPQNAAFAMQNAVQHLNAAQASLQSQQFNEADRDARNCLRSLRIAQTAYWQQAVARLPSPMAGPFTIAFSSLPQHWMMMQGIGSGSAGSSNLLASGEFDDVGTLNEAGWKTVIPDSSWQTRVDLRSGRTRNGRYLQLAARRTENPKRSASMPTAVIETPAVPAMAGDIMEIQGHVRRGSSVRADEEFPLMIFDSELGPEFAVRPSLEPTWHTFRMLRVVAADGTFQASFGLKGGGDVHIDSVFIRKVGTFPRTPNSAGGPALQGMLIPQEQRLNPAERVSDIAPESHRQSSVPAGGFSVVR